MDYTSIDDLKLNNRTCIFLNRASIWTIADVINLPKDDWSKIKNIGHKSLKEVVEKMHAFGYEDFEI